MTDRPLDNWKYRRRMLIACSAFFMAIVVYVLVRELETAAAEQAVVMGIGGVTTLGLGYIFGAYLDDRSKRDAEKVGDGVD